jgi:hypothetical protein
MTEPPQDEERARPEAPQPLGAPARRSRVAPISAVTVALLLLAAVVVVLALALGARVLDARAVERDVAAQFQEREGVAVDLDCPTNMDLDEGARYECTGTTADGEHVTLQITIDDEKNARYSWTEP